MYTLYYGKGGASLAIHAALKEIGVPYELLEVDLEAGQQRSEEYLRLNPDGRVPTMLVEGKPLREAAALMMILADRHPHSGLAPAPGSLARAEWTELIVWMACNIAAPFRQWFYPGDIGCSKERTETMDALRSKIEAGFAALNARLEAGGPYLLGEQFSGADLMLAMYMRWSRNMPRPATEWPALKQYADILRARPSWRHVNEVEALTGW
ncbi:glutathione S-transferase family protein [Pseudoduganella sp. UC29_106]|uniref:glutathione S-transferase family protein n=1 Tax=Pseudoduganella sp. UC29_106 TaxID=3374553 RepID=UPI0037579DE7